METTELLEIIGRDEDGRHQFKANFTNGTAIAQEIVAFSNSGGGSIFVGVSDDGTFAGLQREDMHRLNNLVSSAASQQVIPPVNPMTENISTPNGLVMRIIIPNGISKPYMDNNGAIWVKSGADKRKATAREEIQRLYQSAGLIHGDEIPVQGMTVSDIDLDYFKSFYEHKFEEPFDNQTLSLAEILRNMNLMKDGFINDDGGIKKVRAEIEGL
jgi:ATP-dependent DNA helicase RecG